MDIALKKTLADRVYDKRKYGALELEGLVREALAQNKPEKIEAIIDELTKDFAYAVTHPNYRNGGLIGLAAVAVALGQQELAKYLDCVVPPIMACFGDADSRVRYYACESLYNVAKVAKGEILLYFNEVFDVLCKLVSDPEEGVRTAADLVDRLIKDIVAEKAAVYTFQIDQDPPAVPPQVLPSEDGTAPAVQASNPQTPVSFRLGNFIPVLVERLYVLSPNTRMFLVQWIVLLDSIPDLELVSFLPEFLAGLLQFLSDSQKEIRVATKAALDGLLKDLKTVAQTRRTGQPPSPDTSIAAGLYIVGQDTFIDYARIATIIIEALDSPHQEIRFVALEWLAAFLEVVPDDIRSNLPRVLALLLPTLSDSNQEICESGKQVSAKMFELVRTSAPEELETSAAINALTAQFLSQEEVTRIACLDWLMVLHKACSQELSANSTNALLKLLSDPSDAVVSKDIKLIAQILKHAPPEVFEAQFKRLIVHFNTDRELLASRGKAVILQLCELLGGERIIFNLAMILRDEPDRAFAATMVQNATNNLLLGPELADVRATLSQLHTKQGSALFTTLFKTWSCDGVSALSLTLLSQAYEHAFNVLRVIGSSQITVATLVQIDRLVQLLESPVFAQTRLQLLEPQQYPYLYKCLYGLLMILPQSSAFATLNGRLQSVASIGSLPLPKPNSLQVRTSTNIDWTELLDWFRKEYNK